MVESSTEYVAAVVRTVMAAVVFKINYRELLRDVCHRFSVAVPIYGVPVDDEGLFSVYGEVEISRGNSITEAIRCWGAASSTVDEAEEDAARRIIAKLRDEFMFEVHDSNYEDRKFFENLYERVSTDHIALQAKYKRLKSNYGLLKDYYNNLLTEKEHLVAERKEMAENLEKYCSVLKRPKTGGDDRANSAGLSDEDPAAPPGYYGK
uniref:Uncharacterized protein n=1 Tax=Ananas comosus var. bracteatus TaxID=296719 RepID=A0A6V7PN38_ANACO|nr:unnamed protein product [Ananas comosus var. bracteatus]